jgi:hypothetical protein
MARQGKRAHGCFAGFVLDAINGGGVFPNGLTGVV